MRHKSVTTTVYGTRRRAEGAAGQWRLYTVMSIVEASLTTLNQVA